MLDVFKKNNIFVLIPTVNYTTNYQQLRQAGTLYKVELSITIIIIEKPFRMYHNKTTSVANYQFCLPIIRLNILN